MKDITYDKSPTNTLSQQNMEIPITVAKAIGSKSAEEPSLIDSLKHSYSELCLTIKLQRENYGDFCEDEEELERTLGPIEHDPEPYSNGSIKTRPILKKYAKAICERLELESRIEATEEMLRDVDLTPQQVKLDMKHYVSLSEKKIASQQKQIDTLNEKMAHIIQAVALIASPCPSGQVLSTAMMLNLTSIEEMLLENNINGFNPHDILYASSIKSIEKLLSYGLDINYSCNGSINMPGMAGGKLLLEGIHPDDTQKYYFKVRYGAHIILKLGPYSSSEMPNFYKMITGQPIPSPEHRERNHAYELTPLKIATLKGSLEMTKFLVEKGAKIGDTQYHTLDGPEGDLVAGYLQTHGSKTVIRF